MGSRVNYPYSAPLPKSYLGQFGKPRAEGVLKGHRGSPLAFGKCPIAVKAADVGGGERLLVAGYDLLDHCID